jgi:hypothetical protein
MGAREGRIVGSALLAICFLAPAGVRAMEPAQLPDFLDDHRLPALEEAWRANEQSLETAAEAHSAGAESETTVRARAEELSRRFGASTGPAAKTPPPSVTIPPAVIPEPESKEAAVAPVMPARKSAMNPAKAGAKAPYPTETASTPSAFADKLRLAAPPPPPEAIPPLPRRRPNDRSEAGATATKAAVTRPKPTRTYSATTSANPANPPPDPKAALRGTIMTNELRALGWDKQPE